MNLTQMSISDMIKSDQVTLLDVREPFELMMGSVEGAMNIPLGQIPNRIEEINALPKPIVAFCQSGNRSGQAVAFLKAKGVQDIFNGGGWQEVAYIRSQR